MRRPLKKCGRRSQERCYSYYSRIDASWSSLISRLQPTLHQATSLYPTEVLTPRGRLRRQSYIADLGRGGGVFSGSRAMRSLWKRCLQTSSVWIDIHIMIISFRLTYGVLTARAICNCYLGNAILEIRLCGAESICLSSLVEKRRRPDEWFHRSLHRHRFAGNPARRTAR